MSWDRESNEEYDDGYTRESFERDEEDRPDDGEPDSNCPNCGGEGIDLGCLGRTRWMRCRDCGDDFRS